MLDPFDLGRFVSAQDGVYAAVLEELRGGQKRTHWMWFIFPQLRGLSRSSMGQKYALASREEAQAYAAHPVLGSRLRECTQLVLEIEGRGIEAVFGPPDDLKFRSCMTLFLHATDDHGLFEAALGKYFDGMPDTRTLELLARP